MAGVLKKICWKRRFRRNLARGRSDRDIALTKIGRLGVYYAYENRGEWNELSMFLSSIRPAPERISVLLYDPQHLYPSEVSAKNPEVVMIDDKDIAFSGMPKVRKKEDVRGFFAEGYDLFVDMSRNFHVLDAGVSSMVRAKIKIGKGGEWGTRANDLILSPSPGDSYIKAFARALQTYLPILCKFETSGYVN